jgi:hypothetical protein
MRVSPALECARHNCSLQLQFRELKQRATEVLDL